MKTFRLFSTLLCLALSASLFTSCQKDKATPKDDVPQDNIVGQWDVIDGTATVYSAGSIVYQGDIETAGDIRFSNDNTGRADFSMDVIGEVEQIKGDFTWIIDGFEIVMDKGTEDESRWAIIDDKDNEQALQFTYFDEENELEVEFLLQLVRK